MNTKEIHAVHALYSLQHASSVNGVEHSVKDTIPITTYKQDRLSKQPLCNAVHSNIMPEKIRNENACEKNAALILLSLSNKQSTRDPKTKRKTSSIVNSIVPVVSISQVLDDLPADQIYVQVSRSIRFITIGCNLLIFKT
jgi:hypothetical protein